MSEIRDDFEKINKLAAECIKLAMDSLLVNLRFLDVALLQLPVKERLGLNGVATDGTCFYYDPIYILEEYKKDNNKIARIYLHSLLHCIFNHSFNYDKYNTHLWDLACDIAIENIIMDLELPAVTLRDDDLRRDRLRGLKKNVRTLTAQKIYRHFVIYDLALDDDMEYSRLFGEDLHIYFSKSEEYEISFEQWKKISERIKTDLTAFSKTTGSSEELISNLMEATKEKYDYLRLLESFLTLSEESTINDDEFDYIYYTYGINVYGNIPLVEPLEYKDVKKIKDFVIVIDTSASCQGKIVANFLKHTYRIMKNTENFFSTVNIHIIQCDNEVQSDTKITCDKDFDDFIKSGKLMGFGGTDFRPAFDYVDDLIQKQEFDNLKGMIYFTDGFGIFPEKAPDYNAMFVFINSEDRKPQVPWWVIRVELPEEEFMEYHE